MIIIKSATGPRMDTPMAVTIINLGPPGIQEDHAVYRHEGPQGLGRTRR